MIRSLTVFFLISFLAAPTWAKERSLDGTTTSIKAFPIKGSKILQSTYKVKAKSPSKRLVRAILNLEKAADGLDKLKGPEAEKKDRKIQKIVSGVMDLKTLGQRALIRYWDELGASKTGRKQRSQYQSLFVSLIEANYLDKIRDYMSGKYEIPLILETIVKTKAIVEARIKKTDVDVIVEFHFHKNSKDWRIVDVKLDETSLEATYRSSFNRIIRKKGGLKTGFPELLNVMKERLAELEKGEGTKL